MDNIDSLKFATEIQISAVEFYALKIDLTENLSLGEFFLKVAKVENTDIILILWIFVYCVDAHTQFYINDFQLIIRVLEKCNFLF